MQQQANGSGERGEWIDFSGFTVERHVQSALAVAAELSAGAVVTAAVLLRAILLVERRGEGSKAFSHLATILPSAELPSESGGAAATKGMPSAIVVSPALASSYKIAEKLLHSQSNVWGRDLVTLALLAVEDPTLAQVASAAGSTVAGLQDRWFEFVVSDGSHRHPKEWQSWWRAAGVPLPSERNEAPPEPYLPFAATLSDLDHRNDWIGIRSDVQALSTLVSVNRIAPPLSIAIFGDWGSGKTFLMRKVQERVQILEQVGKVQERDLENGAGGAATGDPDSERPPRYCSSILQIEFNAWHYTESNLWASLVSHIFEKLYEKLAPDDEDREHVDIVERFFDQLETARAARDSARQEVELINAEIMLAESTVGKAQGDVDSAASELVEASGRNIWRLIEEELKKDTSANGSASKLAEALKHFGYEGPLESAQTIYDVVSRFRSVGGRAKEVLGSLLATRRGVVGAAALAFVVAVATGCAIAFDVPVLSLGTTLAGVFAWLAERAESAGKWIDVINSFDERISRWKVEEESLKEQAIAEARTKLENSKDTLDSAKRRLGDAEARVARAKADLRRLTARDQMKRFVDERVTAQAYSKHLGLISMIRRDFEDLSDFMYRDRQPGEPRLVRRIERELQAEIPTVERIILYIDDLDRCQPERVVEVLEAIHLLLAFRLFVVVVAVDPRWVLQSLSRRYPHLAQVTTVGSDGVHAADQNASRTSAATTHDYLEKIFNIPFWVRPMGPRACKSLISGYLGFKEDEEDRGGESEQCEAERFHDVFAEPSARESAISERPLIEPTEALEEAGEARQPRGTRRPSIATLARLSRERDVAVRKIQSVEITGDEQAYIKRLAPFLGSSPRRIKRYANVYRLLKSGLTQREAQMFSAADSTDDFRIVLVFLAVVTGAPTLAPQIFAEAFDIREKFDVSRLIAGSGIDQYQANRFEADNARGALQLLTDVSMTKERIETWVPRVMRYAFRLTPVDVKTADGAA